MNFQDIILKKRNGEEMSEEEIKFVVRAISNGSVPDYQISAWAMAVYFQGMNNREVRDLTLAMAYSGDIVDLSSIEGIKVDKHSTGGVGDKTTMVVVPLVAAADVPVVKMSGRGLGHTGGTIDKFESIPGFRVEKDFNELVQQVNKIKAAVVSQTGSLVPADKKLYAIRDVTATVDSIPLIASSVMGKKIAAGAQAIVLDVKVGSGAFTKSCEEAFELARTMVEIGKGVGRKVVAVLSDMNQPLGKMVGNALEVREAIDCLHGKGPSDLEELSLTLAAHMLLLGGKCSYFDRAFEYARELLLSGKGLNKFREMVSAQGGNLQYELGSYGLPEAGIKMEVRAERRGYVCRLDAYEVGRTAMYLGAGRERLGDKINHAVGIELCKKIGDFVDRGDILAVVHADNRERVETARERLQSIYRLASEPVESTPLIISTVK